MRKANRRRAPAAGAIVLAATLLGGWPAVVAIAAPAAAAPTGASPQSTVLELDGLRVTLGEPVQVAAQLAWQEGPEGRWAFNHPVPSMARFPGGELLVTYSLVADYNDNPRNVSGLQLSTDGGRTWGERYDFVAEHQAMIYLPDGAASLVAIPAYLRPLKPGAEHDFTAAYTRFEHGGRRVVIEPRGVRVVGWPWPVGTGHGYGFFPREAVAAAVPSREWLNLCFDGSALKIQGRLLATAYGMRKGESKYRNVVVASEDRGRTWRYLSTIADASGLPERAEGPNEPALIELASGELMAVFRVGSGAGWNLRRCYSRDGGRSWSRPDVLPAESVEPSLVRIRNGALVLSTGRPGIRLWFSNDPRGQSWRDVDVVAHHNRWAPDDTFRIGEYAPGRWQTSSYTELVELSPNRLLMVYDRGAKPKPAHARDLTRIFVVPIDVERK